MKPENKFRAWFMKEFRAFVLQKSQHARIVDQKHADYASGGVLDMDVAINGFTTWIEFKFIPACTKSRKLGISPLQSAEIDRRNNAGVPAVVVVGLPLGPRRGYEVAVLTPPLSETIQRSAFGPAERAYGWLYTLAAVKAEESYNTFKHIKSVEFAASQS